MPLASAPGAPRKPKEFQSPEILRTRRCGGTLTIERVEKMYAAGGITTADYNALMDLFDTLERKRQKPWKKPDVPEVNLS